MGGEVSCLVGALCRLSLACSVLLQVVSPSGEHLEEEGVPGRRAGAGPWALSVTVTPQLLGLPLTVPFLSPPLCLSPSWSLRCLLALLPCPLPVSWPCSGPSILGGVRPCAHGMCPTKHPSLLWLLLPPSCFCSTFPLHHLLPAPASLGLPALLPPDLGLSLCL